MEIEGATEVENVAANEARAEIEGATDDREVVETLKPKSPLYSSNKELLVLSRGRVIDRKKTQRRREITGKLRELTLFFALPRSGPPPASFGVVRRPLRQVTILGDMK